MCNFFKYLKGINNLYVACRLGHSLVLDPAAHQYYRWLSIISIAVFYNIIIIIGRSVFWELQNLCPQVWFCMDYICDAIYLIDIAVHCRTGKS